MSKKMLVTLIVLMALVLSGLILIQTHLIKTASDIREEQFDRLVTGALNGVADQLELNEQRLARESARLGRLPGFGNSPGNFNIFPRKNFGQISGSYKYSYSERGIFGSIREELQIVITDSTRMSDDSRFHGEEDEANSFEQIHGSNLSLEERRERWLKDMNWRNYKIILEGRMLEERIDSSFLEQAIASSFQQAGLYLDYKYAVRSANRGQDKFLFGSEHYDPKRKEYHCLLFPYDYDGKQPNYLYVYFPERSGYLLRATGLTIIPTVILTGLLIAIFAYAIMVIFRQKKLSMIKNDFINNMTHELKTPISTISLASQMLEDGSVTNTPTTIEHISKVIKKESKRLSFQVEKVLQMAIFNEGRLKLKFKEFNINNTIQTVVSNFELRVNSKNGTLTSRLDARDAFVKGDEVHLTNVVFNLLDNAIKYSEDNPHIVFRTLDKARSVQITITDSGIGMEKKAIPYIFDKFYRVPTGNRHDVKGFGLGLYYVHQLTQAHQGKIRVSSELGMGSTFYLEFPILKK